MPRRPGTDHARLAAKLREIRAATGMSGNRFARHLGWPQSRVSKIETGTQLPTDADITAWLRAAEASGEEDAVTELLTRARVESVSFRHAYREVGGAGAQQRSYRDRDQQASRIATFQPSMVPGLLQTPAYARDVIFLPASPVRLGHSTPEDAERMVSVRIERQSLLYDPDRTLLFVLGEAALWTRMGSLETHLGQLDRLQSVVGLRTIDVCILPFTAVMPLAPPLGFIIYDNGYVMVETPTGEHLLRDPEEIRSYELIFDHLRAESVSGDAAVELIQGVSRRLTTGPEP
ncbi:helix-turn-helix domain-containing protein [Amycolatopsis aidingensis]|uniref:helix-turn-helix domain-containing protein n=1 Tax=Amycolatopsis aidingensis TaxID=2842453 RepID=UPI001C0AA7DC|nr:helix-turn-helix transcriptional regulator [Amycolatopsis aidingensis]